MAHEISTVKVYKQDAEWVTAAARVYRVSNDAFFNALLNYVTDYHLDDFRKYLRGQFPIPDIIPPRQHA